MTNYLGSDSFAYDPAGNATTFHGVGRIFNNADQLTGTGFSYDDRGDPSVYGGAPMTFNPTGGAVSFGDTASNVVLTAGYTAGGLRAWKQESGATRYYLYDGIRPVAELDGSGNVLATNTFGPEGLMSRHTATGGSVFYAFDRRGNTIQRLDGSGNVLSSHYCDAFGKPLAGVTTNDPFDGFGARWGYYTDHATGYVLCTYRYYDPTTGRWLTRDPVGLQGGTNRYRYVHNNPINRRDTWGLNEWNCGGDAGDIGGVPVGGGGVIGPEEPDCGGGGVGNGGRGGSTEDPGIASGSQGRYIPENPLQQQKVRGVDIPLPHPGLEGVDHTVLGGKVGSDGNRYRQSATFSGPSWPQADGYDVPMSRVDWSNHGRPSDHPDVHQHPFVPTSGGWQEGPLTTYCTE